MIVAILIMAKLNSRLPKNLAEIKLMASNKKIVTVPGSQSGSLGNQYLKYIPKAIVSVIAKVK